MSDLASAKLAKTEVIRKIEGEEFAKLSIHMRAVLTIVYADSTLMERCLPYIHPQRDSIEWTKIFSYYWGSGHNAAMSWAYGLWTDQHRSKVRSPFDSALSMDSHLRVAVLRAIGIRWGFRF